MAEDTPRHRLSPEWLIGDGMALTMIDTVPPAGHLSDSKIALGQDGGFELTVGTAEFGNGVSGSVSLEDPSSYRRHQLYNVDTGITAANAFTGAYPSSYGGVSVPDIVGHIRIDQAWGLFQVSAAAHQVRASYYGGLETSGHPDDTWGYAVLGALSLKNLPTGPGDRINVDATYANGATRYVISGTTNSAGGFSMFGDSNVPGAYQSVGFAAATDGLFGIGTGIEKITAWGVRGAFTHNWDPYWSTSVFGAYTSLDYGSNGRSLYCQGFGAAVAGQGVTYNCDPNFSISQVGTVTRWTPVKNLTFSGEVFYTWLDQGFDGTAVLAPASVRKPTAVYEFKDQGTWTFSVRAQRTF